MSTAILEGLDLAGIAVAVPERRVAVKEALAGAEDLERLIALTGVQEKRHAAASTTSADLGFEAASMLLKRLSWDPQEVDALVFVSQFRDYLLPVSAGLLAQRLGMRKDIMAFDVPLGCSGYTHGLSLLGGMMQARTYKKTLLLAGDVGTPFLNPADHGTYALFADAVSATALVQDAHAAPWYSSAFSDGSGAEAIIMKNGGSRFPVNTRGLDAVASRSREVYVEMAGTKVMNFALAEVAVAIQALLDHGSLDRADVSVYVLHQANRLIIETIRKQLRVEPERWPSSLALFGNTSSASIPLTLVHAHAQGRWEPDARPVVLCGFGVGLSWSVCCLPISSGAQLMLKACPDL